MTRLPQAQIEAATLPQDPESRDVIIRSGRYPRWCDFEDLLIIGQIEWYFWDMPKILLGRRSASMTLWTWCSFWFPLAYFICTMLPGHTATGAHLAVAIQILSGLCFWRTAGLVERARWMLMIQSHNSDYDPNEQWWKRLIKQLAKLPGQNRFDIFLLKTYAYWPWLLVTPWACFWGLLRRIVRKPGGRIRLDEEEPLQLSSHLSNLESQENSRLQEEAGPSRSGLSEEPL